MSSKYLIIMACLDIIILARNKECKDLSIIAGLSQDMSPRAVLGGVEVVLLEEESNVRWHKRYRGTVVSTVTSQQDG